MKDENMDILKTMLLTWSDEQVSEAWNLIASEGNRRRDIRSKNMKSTLKEGDQVYFDGRSGRCNGKVVKIKRKKALVEVSGRNWNVPLSMLKKVI